MLQLDTDTLTIEGIAPGCEHEQHPTSPEWHTDGGEHYVKLSSPCGHTDPGKIRVYCQIYPLTGNYTDLGPVAGFHG